MSLPFLQVAEDLGAEVKDVDRPGNKDCLSGGYSAPFSFRVYHFDARCKHIVIARRVIDHWVIDVVLQVPRKNEILKGRATTTDVSYGGVKAAISNALYHGVVVDRISGEVIRRLGCRRSA